MKKTSEGKICDGIQVEIVPQRMLSPDTANKILNEIYDSGNIVRVMIQGSNLPKFVMSGPGKGSLISHPLSKEINLHGQKINMKVTVGRIFVEA